MHTATENRDRINTFLQNYADLAADDLAAEQSKTAAKLTSGTLLDYQDLEALTKAQAEASIWAGVTRIRDYWASNPGQAPEHADLVEAAHEARTKAIRALLSPCGASTSGMSNELDRAQSLAQRDFVRLTAAIYPKGSPLRDLADL